MRLAGRSPGALLFGAVAIERLRGAAIIGVRVFPILIFVSLLPVVPLAFAANQPMVGDEPVREYRATLTERDWHYLSMGHLVAARAFVGHCEQSVSIGETAACLRYTADPDRSMNEETWNFLRSRGCGTLQDKWGEFLRGYGDAMESVARVVRDIRQSRDLTFLE